MQDIYVNVARLKIQLVIPSFLVTPVGHRLVPRSFQVVAIELVEHEASEMGFPDLPSHD